MKCLSYKISKDLSSCWLILLLTVTHGTRSDGERTERAPCFYVQLSRADVNFAFKRVNKKKQRTFLDGELYKICFKTVTRISLKSKTNTYFNSVLQIFDENVY